MRSSLRRPSSVLRPPSSGRRGFALLITVTLLAFLVLLLVSLASLTRVETQVASNNQTLAQARQNALLALNIALGQLQKHTGPDQRVTATADLQPLATIANPATYPANDPSSGQDLTATGGATPTSATRIAATATALNNIDNYWNASRNRRWTGAWKNSNATDVSTVADTPESANPVATLQSWLVSGNETTAALFIPTTAPSGLAVTSDATTDLIKGAADADYPAGHPYRILVGKNSTGATAAADLNRFVTAPQVPIKSTSAPGLGGTSTVIGNYAWWVGDEGVKARANLTDAYAATGTAEANRIRLQSAQRPALEAMTVPGTTDDQKGLAPFSDVLANNTDLSKIIAQSQLPTLQASTVLRAQLDKRWHDLSVSSRGVLSDTKHGGLKHDLTYLLTRPDLTAFRTALNTALPGFAPKVAVTDYNRLLSTTVTPYATQPPLLLATTAGSRFAANGVAAALDIFAYSATWEQLWSYYNLGNSVTPPAGTPAGVFTTSAGDVVRQRHHTGTQHGIYPLLVQTKLFYKLRMSGNTLDADGVDRTSTIIVEIIPVVVLANPYNVDLEAQDYYLMSSANSSGRVRLYYGLNLANPEADDLKISTTANPSNNLPINDNGLGDIKLTIKAPRMEAGRAYVFTLENASTAIPNNANATTASNLQKALVVRMVPDFNPTNVLTFDTGKKIAVGTKQAALTTDNGIISFNLYTSDYTDTLGYKTLVRLLFPHTYQVDSAGDVALVYPFSSGVRHGGGMSAFIHDASNITDCQQNPVYQVNTRSLKVSNAAYTSFNGTTNGNQSDIAISYARTRIKNGSDSHLGDDTPNKYIQANLLWRDPSDPTQVRWGIFNTGDGANDGTLIPPSLVGDAGLVNILFDVPRAAHPPSSVSQLAHFNTAGHIPYAVTSGGPSVWHDAISTQSLSFQPNYPIGNSYPNPFIIRQKVIDGDGGMGFQYDGSYLLNEALQDRFFFSTFPATGSFDFATGKLINNRNRPFRPQSEVATDDPANFRTDSRSASKNLLVDGAFNINSTSVEAWKALLSSLKNVPVGGETATGNLSAPFARTLFQTGGATDSRTGGSVNAWTGTINLSTAEIDSLAREIVLQVRRRGPFLSLADFTNRRIIATTADASLGVGVSGALQAAVDRILNQAADVTAGTLRNTSKAKPGNARLADNAFILSTATSGAPGYILQSDILSNIGPVLTARSDTFTIRTYGDVQNPATGDITGRAWCEAIVQRTPDYVDTTPATATPAAGSTAETFGRRYQIVSFRWLSPSDI